MIKEELTSSVASYIFTETLSHKITTICKKKLLSNILKQDISLFVLVLMLLRALAIAISNLNV